MFTTYLTIYGVLTVVGAVEIFTGWLKPFLGLGVHVFLSIFAVIFLIQFIGMLRQRTADADTQNKAVYNAHRMSLTLGTLLLLIVWLCSV